MSEKVSYHKKKKTEMFFKRDHISLPSGSKNTAELLE